MSIMICECARSNVSPPTTLRIQALHLPALLLLVLMPLLLPPPTSVLPVAAASAASAGTNIDELMDKVEKVDYDQAWFDLQGSDCAVTVCGVCMATTREWPRIEAGRPVITNDDAALVTAPRVDKLPTGQEQQQWRRVRVLTNAEHVIERPSEAELSLGPPNTSAAGSGPAPPSALHHQWIPCASFMFYRPCANLILWGHNAGFRAPDLTLMHLPFQVQGGQEQEVEVGQSDRALQRFAARPKFAVYSSSRCIPHRENFFDRLSAAAAMAATKGKWEAEEKKPADVDAGAGSAGGDKAHSTAPRLLVEAVGSCLGHHAREESGFNVNYEVRSSFCKHTIALLKRLVFPYLPSCLALLLASRVLTAAGI